MKDEIKTYSTKEQKLYLEILIADSELAARCRNILDPEYFDRGLRQAAEFIKGYLDKYDSVPTTTQIQATTNVDLESFTAMQVAPQKEWFLDEFEQFARHKALDRAILKSVDLLDKKRYGEVERLIKDASSIGLPKTFGTDYFADPRGRLEALRSNNGQVSTGWKSIDEKLYGGFNRGELNIFAAPSGGGKSLFLQNLSLHWAQQGLNGVYFSLELAEGLCSKRIDSMLTGVSSKEIYRELDNVDLTVRMAGKKAGRLQIVQLTPGVTVNDMKSWLKEFQIHSGLKMDYIIVDYLDLMHPVSVKVSAENLFIKDKYVSEELRAMATQGQYLFATASQLNRGAVESVEFDHSHISGGLSKIQTADNVIGIFNSMTMRERQRVQIQFMKTRSSSAVGTKVELQFNTDTLHITDLDEDAPAPPTQADVLHDRLKRQSQVDGTSGKLPSAGWERATGTPAWEKPPQGGTHAWDKPMVQSGDKKESPAIRTMDSPNSKLASILKKV
jgi:archaellum biogenesis ATPase FlaH